MKFYAPFVISLVLLSNASAGTVIDVSTRLDLSRIKEAPVQYYSFDLENPARASVPLPSLVFRGEKNLIEKCRPIILERIVYPVLRKSKHAVAAFDFRVESGLLEHRIYWIPGGIHEGRMTPKDCNEIGQSDYLEFLACQDADCN